MHYHVEFGGPDNGASFNCFYQDQKKLSVCFVSINGQLDNSAKKLKAVIPVD